MAEDEEAALDLAFELLADRRRRAVVEVLRTAPRGSLAVTDLVEAVAAVVDTEADALTPTFYHTHLPKLDDADVVDYDRDDGTVTYDADPLVERCLDVAETYRSDKWVRGSSETR